MNPIVTGDPTIDAMIAWLTDGGKLTSTAAAFGIAAIVRWVLLPMAKTIMIKLGKTLTEQSKVYLAYALSIFVAIIVGLFDKSGVSMTVALAVGLAAGAMSIGIHQTGKVPTEQGNVLKGIMGYSTVLQPRIGQVLQVGEPFEECIEKGKGEGTDTGASADPPPVDK